MSHPTRRTESKLKPHQGALLAASLISAVIMGVPLLQQLMIPLLYLNTHIHEVGHAVAALATGGQVSHIEVHATGAGVTPVRGGNILLVASAGYVGSAIAGALMIVYGRTPKGAATVLRVAAVALGVALVLWVRGDAIGVVSAIGWTLLLWLLSARLQGNSLIFAAQFLGLQQCLNALQSVYILLHLSAFTPLHSDAVILAQVTGIPALIWAGAWTLFSLILVVLSLHRAWRTPVP
jgi:hypothetical protein